MNQIKSILSIAAFSLLILGLPVIASAQYGNGGYYPQYPNGGYGNSGYSGNIRGTVQALKSRARSFENMTDRNDRYDRNNRYGGESLEDLADQFKKATDRLEDAYGRGRNMNNSADEARRVLDLGSRIDRVMYSSRGDYQVQNMWNLISNDLRVLANAYGYGNYGNGRYNDRDDRYNNRNNRRNNRNGRFPFPGRWPF